MLTSLVMTCKVPVYGPARPEGIALADYTTGTTKHIDEAHTCLAQCFAALPLLRTLDLSHWGFQDGAVQAVVSNLSSNMQSLKLSGNDFRFQVSDTMVTAVARMQHLRDLALASCSLSNSGVQGWAEHLRAMQLEKLDLSGPRLFTQTRLHRWICMVGLASFHCMYLWVALRTCSLPQCVYPPS